jgi:DNA-directed RNA polymerase specialized sigma24 family protein
MDSATIPLPSQSLDRPASETDWSSFIDTYGRVILAWFRQSHLSAADAYSVVRELLTRLHSEFSVVANEPMLKFRSWLQFAAHATWCDVLEKEIDANQSGKTSPTAALLVSVETHDQFLNVLKEECSRQRRGKALRRVQPLADQADWTAFSLAVLQQQPLAEVAATFQCQDSAIQAALYRVHSRLAEEYLRMEEMT